jgi:sulfite reductase alpha subunit-like flavoprotein
MYVRIFHQLYVCRLLEMSGPSGADLYHTYCTKERHSYLEVLEDFTSVNIRLENLLDLIPALAPRHYSIASSDKYSPGVMELCVGMVEYKTKYGRRISGTCSAWLSSLKEGVSSMPQQRSDFGI